MKLSVILLFSFVFAVFQIQAKPTDSLRVEKRDGVKYIVHRAIKGETLASLAQRYDVTEGDIISANPLITLNIVKGQIVLIPLNVKKYGDVQAATIAPLAGGSLPFATSLPSPAPTANENTEVTVKGKEIDNDNIVKVISDRGNGKVLRKEILDNDTLLVYEVGPESSVTELAKKFNVPESNINNVNVLKSSVLTKGQVIKVLLTPAVSNEDVVVKTEKKNEVIKNNLAATEKVEKKPEVKTIKDTSELKQTKVTSDAKMNESGMDVPGKIVERYFEDDKVFGKYLVGNETTIREVAFNLKVSASDIEPYNNLTNQQVARGQVLKVMLKKEKKSEVKIAEKVKSPVDSSKIKYVYPEGVNSHDYNFSDYRDNSGLTDQWAENILDENLIKVNSLVQDQGTGGANKTHVVGNGEDLNSIAKLYGVRVTDIINWNSLNTFRVREGQSLIINQARYDENFYVRNSLPNPTLGTATTIENIIENGLGTYDNTSNFVGILHATLPVGKLVKLINKDNFLETYARVSGKLENPGKNVVIQIDYKTAKKLKVNNPTFKVKLVYGVIEQ